MAKRRRRRPRQPWRTVQPYLTGALLGGVLVWAWLQLDHGRPSEAARPDPCRTPPQGYAWAELPEPHFPVPPYARFLSGVSIVLDPGHVGQRDPGGTWKRGPTGLREAEVNLRVAQFLRQFLEAAGARVRLTRESEVCLDLPDQEDLQQRARLANELRADLLLSIHHNASSDPRPNYTALFYHSSPTHSLAGQCAARHLLTGLNDALRLETHLECAVLSDELLYKDGLAILRAAQVPAVLCEASFHSNPQEEARLRDPVYNRREAYGLFLGLARWAQAGLPRVRLLKATRGSRSGGEALVELDDGLSARGGWGAELPKLVVDSLVVRVDGKAARHTLDLKAGQVRITLPDERRGGGPSTLFVDFENTFGQHVLHPLIDLPAGGS